MPNTLCHFALQTPLNRLAIKQTDLLWVLIGCIIPDLPWILQKALVATGGINPYDLRLYVMVQASLSFCLLLSLAIASVTLHPIRVFLILSANCFLHLLVDSLQIKWGNGVHLIAPLSWEIFHFGLFWPEHIATQIISLLGIPVIIYNWHAIAYHGLGLTYRSVFQIAATTLLILLYFTAPFVFFNQLEATDSYYLKTIRNVHERAGKDIEFDRARYDATTQTAEYFSGELFKIEGTLPPQSGRVSLQGRFTSPDTIFSISYHYHKDYRDLLSITGLFMACTLIAHSLILTSLNKTTT